MRETSQNEGGNNMKKILNLKPTGIKVVLTLLIAVVIYWLGAPYGPIELGEGLGVEVVAPLGIANTYLFVIVDMVVSYLMACLITNLFSKSMEKKLKK